MITNRLYADDIILLATSEAELQEFVDRLDRVSRKYTWRNRTVSPRTPGRRIAHDVADGWERNGRDGRVFYVTRQGEAFHSLSRHFATTSSFANPLPVSRRHLYALYFLIIPDFKTFWTLPGTFPNTSGSRILLPDQQPGPEMECQQVCFTSASDYIPPVPLESIFTRFRTNCVQNGG